MDSKSKRNIIGFVFGITMLSVLFFSTTMIEGIPNQNYAKADQQYASDSAIGSPAYQREGYRSRFNQQSITQLPDLVDEIKPAVVNIRSTIITKSQRRSRQPREELFRKFFEGFDLFEPPRNSEPQERESESSGSGFIISSDGYIVTNYHVVQDAEMVRVVLQDRRIIEAEVIGSDKETDLALLKIPGENFPSATLGNSDQLRIGETVFAIGSPFGMDFSVTQGIVSAKARNGGSQGIGGYVPYIQTDVAINPGNSGGPLYNLRGEVIGVNTQIFTRTGGYMGISLSIPTRVVEHVVAELRELGYVRRGKLGVYVREVSMDDADSFELPKPAGALVVDIESGSVAEQAGIQPGDVITKFNHEEILYSYELPPKVGFVRPGHAVEVELIRGGKIKYVEVEIGEYNSANLQASRAEQEASGEGIGILVEDLPEKILQRYDLDKGVVIAQIISQRARRLGLNIGDIVLEVQGQEVTNAQQFDEIVTDLESGKSVWILVSRPRSGQQLIVTLKKG